MTSSIGRYVLVAIFANTEKVAIDTVRLVKLVLIFAILFMIRSNAFSEEPPLLGGLDKIRPEIINTEVADEISERLVYAKTLSAKEGYKLVIVTLKGIINFPCSITLVNNEIAAIYKDEKVSTAGYCIKTSDGFKPEMDSDWTIPPQGGTAVITRSIREAGNIIIKVAFVLPKNVDDFFIGFIALAKGKAQIALQTERKPKK